MWFAGKAGPDRTVPASEGEDSRQPPSIPGPDKRSGPLLYLLTLLSLSEARQRGVAPTENTPAPWSSVLDPSQFLDTPQLLAIHLLEDKCQKELASPSLVLN